MQGVLFKLLVKQQTDGGQECHKTPVKIHYECTKP